MTDDEILTILQSSGALLDGHFELRSGLHSDRFFQCANVLRFPNHAERLCTEAVARFLKTVPELPPIEAVISPALGGIIVGHEVARAMGVKSIFAEKSEGSLVLRRFSVEPGASYVVAEDVITRGGRVQETVDLVTGAGGRVAGIVLLVDRSGGNVEFPYPTSSLLQMAPTLWQPDACPLCAQNTPLVHPGS